MCVRLTSLCEPILLLSRLHAALCLSSAVMTLKEQGYNGTPTNWLHNAVALIQ